jgi:hypothetical protein
MKDLVHQEAFQRRDEFPRHKVGAEIVNNISTELETGLPNGKLI